jgi:multicomponent Na+:H+ antiporter subunit G
MIREVLSLFFLWSGLLLVVIAGLGLLRMPDMLCRAQVTTIATTLGKIGIFAAAALAFPGGEVLTRGLLIVFFLFLTSPIGAHMLTRAAYLRKAPLDKRTHNEDTSKTLH